jgi:hypothetical protein
MSQSLEVHGRRKRAMVDQARNWFENGGGTLDLTSRRMGLHGSVSWRSQSVTFRGPGSGASDPMIDG